MSFSVRAADLATDRALLIDLLSRNLPRRTDGPTFDWLYHKNPHGGARAWLAMDTIHGTAIGVAAAFPRRIYVDTLETICWVLGDFVIDEKYRSLGPALELQRACLTEVGTERIAFCYDFPSISMMAIYRRLQIKPFCQAIRLAKPLRVDRKIKQFMKNPSVAGALSGAGNLLVRLAEIRVTRDGGLNLSIHENECGSEFSELASRVGGRSGICIQRSAEYLNWRYMNNPLCRYELFTARMNGALLGYAAFLRNGEDAMLVDLFGVEDSVALTGLVAHGVARMRARGVQTVSAVVIEFHPWRALLENLGFKRRESSPMVMYMASGPENGDDLGQKRSWLFMQGDRDS